MTLVRALSIAALLAAGGCKMNAAEDDGAAAAATDGAFSGARVAYRVAVDAPSACYTALEGAVRVDGETSVTVTRTLSLTEAFCAQVVTEVVFEGVIEDVPAAVDEVAVEIANDAGEIVGREVYRRAG